MSYQTLDQYRCEVCQILRNYWKKKKAYQFIPRKPYYSGKNCCAGIDEELIGKCVFRLIKSYDKFQEGKSKLDLKKYCRMNVIYEARSYIQQNSKQQNKYLPLYDFTFVSKKNNPLDILTEKEEKGRMIDKVNKAPLGYKEKKYMLELLNGKALIDIAHENKTTRPVVQRIVNEGVSKLKGG